MKNSKARIYGLAVDRLALNKTQTYGKSTSDSQITSQRQHTAENNHIKSHDCYTGRHD